MNRIRKFMDGDIGILGIVILFLIVILINVLALAVGTAVVVFVLELFGVL